jgi:3-hydroxyisobutyrate dehydrogenase-like beta-hydroxyacid dehydrogenase
VAPWSEIGRKFSAFFDRVRGCECSVCKALKTVVNTCTVGGPFVREVEASCAATGVTVIDVPISGGVAGAKAGTLAVMVSQDQSRIVQIIEDGTRKQ